MALHSGEPHLAETIVRAAVAAGQGGDAAKPRLFLLQAWSAMQQDNPEEARLAINEASKANHWPLVPRDEFLCAALEVGLARRSGEVHGLVLAWERAREAMLHTSVDLYSLLPWGELMITAARLRETRRVSHYLDEAWKLLHQLGDPPLWAVPLHWAGVQAALLNESPADLAPHALRWHGQQSTATSRRCLLPPARPGCRSWPANFPASDVEAAARGLKPSGMPWEGARLAGHAAAGRTSARTWCACCPAPGTSIRREVRPAPARPGPPKPAAFPRETATAACQPDGFGLSEREKEVARLVLEGKTYREIGEAIYISPRTAEHHIARMRRRLGAENRSDLLVRLRLALGAENPQRGVTPSAPNGSARDSLARGVR